ncbi:MAG: hypothetical protein HY826_05965 [Actinobacteria bacterium]|nr:hypothetical protein [Actinomycetota bacterium]
MEQRNWPRTRDELNESPIQVRVATVEHIFNPMDPTPLDERSLNQEVADWIEEWAEDLEKNEPITVEIYVADGRLAGRERAIVNGLHNHFEYREWQSARQLRKLLREGRLSLLIGIVAIAGFNAASRAIGGSANPVIEVVHDGLAVLGWVSMWKPLEILLYDWWPIRRERRACLRLAEATVIFPAAPV